MCGILGSWNLNLEDNYQEKFINNLNLLKNRGPDNIQFTFEDINKGKISLGHTRLAIIELTDLGNQPFNSEDNNYSIIYNGMIFNYLEIRNELVEKGIEFKTDSDTEVLLKSWIFWKEKCLEKINGMFSFVILDRNKNEFICVRDFFGIKPLYYYLSEKKFIFGSEISVVRNLISENVNLDKKVCAEYLLLGNIDNTSQTFIKNLESLEPGTLLKVNFSQNILKTEKKKYWSPKINDNNLGLEEAKKKVRKNFLENIKYHLRSDVPIAIFLSGGIDSSAIACAIRYLDKNIEINAFSFLSDDEYSEEKWIDLVNKSVNLKTLNLVKIEKITLSELDKIIINQDIPFLEMSIIAEYILFKEAKKKGFKVILQGQGGDEVLGGYLGYPGFKLRDMLKKNKYFEIINFYKNWSKNFKKNYLQLTMRLFSTFLSSEKNYFFLKFIDKDKSPNWVNDKKLNQVMKLEKNKKEIIKKDYLKAKLKNNIFSGGLNALLRYADRSSMAQSIECRVPYLSKNFVELIFSLKEEYLVSDDAKTKYIFRESMQDILPSEIIERKDKIGFKTQDEKWILNMKDEINKILNEDFFDLDFIDNQKYKDHIRSYLNGEIVYTPIIWRMINFLRWYQLTISKKKNL
jgi:asparagine synthase (glutamine-hydrolysing)